MKLIVQIPCLNEEATLPQTVADIPREVPGVDEVEILVIDDGSTDRTVEVARGCGVDHIVRFTGNKGLAQAFSTGLDGSLRLGADIIVHTDAWNQYRRDGTPRVIAPALQGKSHRIGGRRAIEEISSFSWPQKRWALRKSGAPPPLRCSPAFHSR